MELSSQSVLIRTYRDSDVSALSSLANNRKIWNNLRDYMPYPYTEEEGKKFIEQLKGANPQYTFAIEWEGQFVGTIGMNPDKDVHRFTAEVGYWLGEPFWGKGITTTALRLISKYAFEQLQLRRLHSGVFEYNKGSMRVMEKAGYQLEGVFRKNVFKNEQFWDEYRYARLAE